MSLATRCLLKLRETLRGQTMTEYALILGAVAIVVYVFYQNLGVTVSSFVNTVDTLLTNGS